MNVCDAEARGEVEGGRIVEVRATVGVLLLVPGDHEAIAVARAVVRP